MGNEDEVSLESDTTSPPRSPGRNQRGNRFSLRLLPSVDNPFAARTPQVLDRVQMKKEATNEVYCADSLSLGSFFAVWYFDEHSSYSIGECGLPKYLIV